MRRSISFGYKNRYVHSYINIYIDHRLLVWVIWLSKKCFVLFFFFFFAVVTPIYGFPWWLSSKESACQCKRWQIPGFNPWVWKMPWRKKWQLTQVFLPEKSHGQRNYSPWSHKRVRQDWVIEQQQLQLHLCKWFQ